MEVDAILLRYTVYNIGAKRFPYDLGDYRLALTVGSVKVMGQAPDNDTTGPTMLSTYAEYGNRPYVDALLELNPLDGNCSVRITVYVQSMRIVFDAVSLRCSHRVRQWHVVIATLMGAPAGFFFQGRANGEPRPEGPRRGGVLGGFPSGVRGEALAQIDFCTIFDLYMTTGGFCP